MITKWLSKIKSPYVMAMFVIVVGAILRMFISAGPALGAMMIATFVPVLLANKCSKETAAVSTLAFGMITFGPADPNALTAAPVAAASGLDTSVLCFVILSAVLAGCMCSPVNPVVLVTSEKCGVSTGVLFKRLAPIMSVVIVVTVVFVCAFF